MPVVQVCNFNSASVRSVDYLSACAERTERTNALTFVPLNDWLFPTKTDFRFTRNVATRVPFRRLTTSQPKRRRNEDDDNNQLPDSNIEDENRILSIRLLNNHTLDIVSFVSKPEDRVVDFAKQSRVFISTEQNAKFRTPFISRIEDNEQMEKIIKTLLNTWRVKTLHLILKKQSKFIERLLKENNCSLLTAKLRGYSITSTKLYSGNTNLSSTKPTAFATFAAATTNSITRLSQYTMLLLSKPLALFDDDANVVYSLAYLFGLHSIYDNLYGIRGDVLAKLTKKPQFNNIFYSKVGFLIVRLQTYIDNAQRRPTLITRFEQHCVFHMSNDTTCEENRTPCHEQVYYYLFDQRNELAFAIFITTNPLSAVSSVKQEIKLNEQAVSVVPSTSFLSLYSNEQHAAYPSLRGLFFPGDENARLLLPFDIKLYFNNCIQYQRNYYRRKYYNWLHYFCVTLVCIDFYNKIFILIVQL